MIFAALFCTFPRKPETCGLFARKIDFSTFKTFRQSLRTWRGRRSKRVRGKETEKGNYIRVNPKPKVVNESLKTLTLAVRKHLQRITDALSEPDLGKREKTINRLMKALEVANDAAMIAGLGLSYAKVAQLKSANLKTRPPSEHTKETSPHHDLIRFAEQKACGSLPNYAAAAACIKWLLEAGYDPLEIKDCWNELGQQQWRTSVTIFTVKNEIGIWKTSRANKPQDQTRVGQTLRAVANVKARHAN